MLIHPWSWGWAFELKYDSLPRLDFKGVVCILNYRSSSGITGL
jgi:hypothetical protein